ncbi:squalene--hopene cyclase [Metabacillus litoralis]|uniref:Squalene--hopene cyclase n=1 Tax=Metabacillus litoralis TaxID=152268 RepID=A0A179SVI9_9BACI|nr:squalene--hopene cyclase [Metabacillus litoralis]OAS85298.1 squalene--hopene cyclase [Metabacillus litoralis]
MITNEIISDEISRRVDEIIKLQQEDGSWKFCFEGGLMTDAFMIMTIRSLEIEDEEILIEKLTKRIITLQSNIGIWKAYPDEKGGNLSTTVQAYTALLYSGLYSREHPILQEAEQFIRKNGGLSNTHFMTKWMLAVNGLYRWPKLFYIPMTFLLIPPSYPLNFYQFSTYARIHFVPMLIAANKKYSIQSKFKPNLDHLFDRNLTDQLDQWDLSHHTRTQNPFITEMKNLLQLPIYLHRLGYDRAERYMLQRIEGDGTLFSYASATFFMIYALLALDYEKKAPIIKRSVDALKQLITSKCNGIHLENSTSTIWDTALISYALQETNVSLYTKAIKNSTTYILSKQHSKKGDWKIHNQNIVPGGWGFSHNNTINPDNDDTSAALRAITRSALTNNRIHFAWNKGVTFLLSMQNSNGGWAAFEKNTDFELLTYLPLENAKDAAIDPSTADLTGRALEFLGNYAGLTLNHPSIKAGVNWLLNNQESNGSWYGRWGVCYIYGTWAAVTGLVAVGVSPTFPAIQKALKWLESIQLGDGGWGESCSSSEKKQFIPLHFSTPSQTSWALDTLIQANDINSESVQKGVAFLLNETNSKESSSYPTGVGLPGQFYINYHSYNYIFPLLTLSHYLKVHLQNP